MLMASFGSEEDPSSGFDTFDQLAIFDWHDGNVAAASSAAILVSLLSSARG
jgi:hypothetical protein